MYYFFQKRLCHIKHEKKIDSHEIKIRCKQIQFWHKWKTPKHAKSTDYNGSTNN